VLQAAGELVLSADGRFLYASNRGLHGGLNNIGVFAVSPADGSLTPLGWEDGGGVVDFPRHISLSSGDRFLLVRARTCVLLAGECMYVGGYAASTKLQVPYG
jgi:6-phosphogluconolactonase (cycloisomerase 2 family)